MEHEENGGGVETQISMANVHKDHNVFAFTGFTDPMMIVLVFRLYICVELASIFHYFNFVFVFIGSVDKRCSAVHRGASHDGRFVVEVSEMVIQAPRHKI